MKADEKDQCDADLLNRVPEAYPGGNFAPVAGELTTFEIKVRGEIPEELDGRLLRIGPNPAPRRRRGRQDWLVETGMVHGLRIRGGRAEWYRRRYTVNTDDAAKIGRKPIPGPGLGFGAVNTNVVAIAGRIYAVVEAGALPIELDGNLESVARCDFRGGLESGFTAHPKLDPRTFETLALTYRTGRAPLKYVVIDKAGNASTRAELCLPHRPMVHDIGFTDNFVIVMDLPVTFQPAHASGNIFPYRWDEGSVPRLGLLPRSGDVAGVVWFEAPLCFVYHILNAFEDGRGNVIVDVIRHPRGADHVSFFQQDRPPVLARWTADLRLNVLREQILYERGCEFPSLDARRLGRNHRFGYTAYWGPGVSFGPALKHDLPTGGTQAHDFGPGRVSLEPVFVPRAGGVDEDDGYVMTYVFDAERQTSDVVILAAQDFSGPPLAVIELPVRVPFGFHGNWIPNQRTVAAPV